ncbi:HlyD family secretion protein [Nioella nitratireducens]|uniref:HlyD family secretion protein n=1 Tax=Nioella nitratireducens TaxID=1287720 RepID=UPI0008FCE70B|nr:HlyD family secretion protein [Nioella nitratireducens]
MNAESKPIKPEAAAPAPQPETNAPPNPARKKRRRGLMLVVPVAIALAGGGAYLLGGRYVSTDNAYVHQPMLSISSDVAGRISDVDVRENQQVALGDTMFRLDPEPYQIAVDQAEAALASARLAVVQLRANYATAEAQLQAAESILEVQTRELERQQSLTERGISTSAALDQATVASRSAANNVDLARRQVEAAAAALGGDPEIETDALPSVRAALAQLDIAQRNLAHTEIHAPSAGIVSQVESLNVGQFVGAGTAVATLVDSDQTWIEANFKETQLDGLEVGQPVEITIDAYPGLTLRGTLESFGSATGSQFSLIPAQNATGNWVKVVQRIAVRIRIEDDTDHPLRDGMSAHVSVDTGNTHLADLL